MTKCVCVGGGEVGWKSLTGIVVGENQLFGVWWVRGGGGGSEIKITDRYCGG